MSAAIWHAAMAPAMSRLVTTVGPAGLVVGRDHGGDLATVRLFRAEPSRAVLIGGAWTAQLIVFRSLAQGAEVTITTATPGPWAQFAQRGGAGGEVRVVGAGTTVTDLAAPGSPYRPVLHVDDIGTGHAPPARPWECRLAVLPVRSPAALTVLGEAQVVLVAQPDPDVADLLVSGLRVTPDDATRLAAMHDDMLGLIVESVPRYLWFATTSIEEEVLGRPRRLDGAGATPWSAAR